MKEIENKIKELLKVSSPNLVGDKDFLSKFDAKMKAQEKLMTELKELARANNVLLGRMLRFLCADSYAYYVITKVNARTVHVKWIDYCDGWQDDRLGVEGTINLSLASAKIDQEDAMDKLFSKKIYFC